MKQGLNSKEREIVLALKKGDSGALKTLYKLYSGKLYQYSFKICKSKLLAEDVVQDVFVKIWERRETLREEHSIQPFLFTVTRHRLLDLIKRAAKETEILQEITESLSIVEHQVEEDITFQESYNRLQHAINNLPTQRQLIFRLSREEGLSYAEIAQTLGITKGTVNIQIVKALKSIRDYLDMKEVALFICLLLFFL